MTIKTLTAVLHKKEATELYLEEFPIPRIDKVFMTAFEAAMAPGIPNLEPRTSNLKPQTSFVTLLIHSLLLKPNFDNFKRI